MFRVEGNFYVFLAHSGKFDHRDGIVVILVEIERQRPATKKLSPPYKARPKRQLEERIEIIPQAAPLIQ